MNGRSFMPGKPVPESEIPDYTIRRDTLDEVFSAVFRRRLRRINEIVKQSGEPLEGNIFYREGENGYAESPPTENLAPARRNVWRAVRFKERLLEVGVNAGHSALLALSTSPKLEYYGVDIMSHAYTIECLDFLQGVLPCRVPWFRGDSLEVLPQLAVRRDELMFDILCVDGGHPSAVFLSHLSNCLRIPKGRPGRHLPPDVVHPLS